MISIVKILALLLPLILGRIKEIPIICKGVVMHLHSGLRLPGSLLLFALFLSGAMPAYAGYAHYVLDANSGKVLASQNADTLNHPASLTKMMTLYLTFEALHAGRVSWSSDVPVSRRAAHTTPLKLGLREGGKITVHDAVLGSIVLSANDAAQALCDYLAGRGDCGTMMTRKARQLGMSRTQFFNGSGLPDNRQVTTARDMARLGFALIRDYPQEYKLFSTRSFSYKGRTIHGHNRLMYRYRGMDGIKTGYTNASGFNIVTAVNDNGRRVIGVVLGGRTAGARDAKMATLLDASVPEAVARSGGLKPEPAPAQKEELVASLAPMPLPVPASRYGRASTKKNPVATAAPSDDEADNVVENADDEANADNVSSDPKALWQVQIAAVSTEDEARGLLEKARGKVGSKLNGVMNFTQFAGGNSYRARFIGFSSKDTADAACKALKAGNFKCLVIDGNG
jgi:serine-type D-Ala-D-Ala carboxypeptidase (penicillin-binding protein 5/6)